MQNNAIARLQCVLKMCQQMLFFFVDKNLSEPVDLNQFFFFVDFVQNVNAFTALSFSFLRFAFTMIAKWLEEATFSDSGHTTDPNMHNISISINHIPPNNVFTAFVHEIKKN